MSGMPQVAALPAPTHGMPAQGQRRPPLADGDMEFLALLSHELRGPLSAILPIARMLIDRRPMILQADVDAAIVDIAASAQRLERTIDNMLVLARSDVGLVAEIGPVLLQREVLAAVEAYRPNCGIPIVALLPASLAPVLANRGFLEQIVTNLLSNADKYGDPSSTILVRSRTAAAEVLTSVESGGPLLDEADVARLFEPFFRRRETASSASGLGLGLTVCRRLAEAQGGHIEATALASGGLAVAFSLPICAD